MQKTTLIAGLMAHLLVLPAVAKDATFAETSGEMVHQMLGDGFGATRSFPVPKVGTRAISIQRRDQAGREEMVLVKTSTADIDPAARLKVEFDVNSANLSTSAHKVLRELGLALVDEKIVQHQICIKGHTDSDGAEDYNIRLSFARSEAVKAYLKATLAVETGRLHVFGYGESLPLVANNSLAGKQANRRVEVSLNCAELAIP